MRCPMLAELPPPPPSKTGWPWTEESEQLPDTMPGGEPWPKVSIVTPSFNQGQFIEETIRSVLLQGYPDLEYIIIDGGSTDQSVEVIHEYEQWLAHWVSEPDEGQADAIQKGFELARGAVVTYLNSDDVYMPRALCFIGTVFAEDQDLALAYGDCLRIDEQSKVIGKWHGQDTDFFEQLLRLRNPICQPSAFLTSAALDRAGGVDPAFHAIMDYDLWARAAILGLKIRYLPTTLSKFRLHPASKTTTAQSLFAEECFCLVDKYLTSPTFRPAVAPYEKRLLGAAHLRSAGTAWLRGEARMAFRHYRNAILMAPRLLLCKRSVSLLLRFALRRRTLRSRGSRVG